MIIPENKIYKLLLDVIFGLKYIEKQNLLHGNLKPNNLIIDDKGRVKIVDIGLNFSTNDSLKYMSPEILKKGKAHDIKSDIWSVGFIFFTLCCFEVIL